MQTLTSHLVYFVRRSKASVLGGIPFCINEIYLSFSPAFYSKKPNYDAVIQCPVVLNAQYQLPSIDDLG